MTVILALTLTDLERSFYSPCIYKGVELYRMLLLKANSFVGTLLAPSYLTMSDLERLSSRSSKFRALISLKGVARVYTGLYQHQKITYGDSGSAFRFDFERPLTTFYEIFELQNIRILLVGTGQGFYCPSGLSRFECFSFLGNVSTNQINIIASSFTQQCPLAL